MIKTALKILIMTVIAANFSSGLFADIKMTKEEIKSRTGMSIEDLLGNNTDTTISPDNEIAIRGGPLHDRIYIINYKWKYHHYSGCGIDIAARSKKPATIKGTVIDKVTGQPVEGVDVIIDGRDKTTETDSTGVYMFQLLYPRSYRLKISSPHYKPLIIDSVHTFPDQVTEQNIELVRTKY